MKRLWTILKSSLTCPRCQRDVESDGHGGGYCEKCGIEV